MSPSLAALDLAAALAARGIDLAALGAAYVVLIASALVAAALFAAARAYLVVSPNRSARDYGTYTALVLATLAIATVLENQVLPRAAVTLPYVALPQLVALLALHVNVARRQEPWLIALGAAALGASLAVAAAAQAYAHGLRAAHWVVLLVFAGLLGFVCLKSVSTKRAFTKASSIYIGSKESVDAPVPQQKPWLGLAQWVALIGASIALAVLNALLKGSGLGQIPAVDVALESTLLIAITGLVAAVPALSYWLARKAWMPELTRFVWLVWIVVGFAFTYGNYLRG